jgi:hypothetical protein
MSSPQVAPGAERAPLGPEWIVEGTLIAPQQSRRRRRAPAYLGKLRIRGREYAVQCWWIRDGAGHRCLAFARSTTRQGVLWPACDRVTEDGADFFGLIRLEGHEWRLRAWREQDRDAIRVRVKW